MVFRAFISVDVDATPKLMEFSEKLRGSGAQLKVVNLKIVHLTLKFLGDTEEALIDDIEKAITLSVQGIEPFTIDMRSTGAFPNLNYMKVIWVGLENADPLVNIAKTLNNELSRFGFKREKKGFRPHITIARVRGPKNKHALVDILKEYQDEDFGSQRVESIRLKKSVLSREGPTYSTIKDVKFSGA
jgi:2'-5' RNA ligase